MSTECAGSVRSSLQFSCNALPAPGFLATCKKAECGADFRDPTFSFFCNFLVTGTSGKHNSETGDLKHQIQQGKGIVLQTK